MVGWAVFDAGSHRPLEKPRPSLSEQPTMLNCPGLYLSMNVMGTPMTP